MRTILDTSVVVAGLHQSLPGDLAVSTVSLAELHFGVLIARSAEARAVRLRRLGEVERAFEPIPVDEAVARGHGRAAAAVAATGRSPRPRSLDLLIAATAVAHSARLATLNASDLRGVEDLVEVVDLGSPGSVEQNSRQGNWA